MFIKQFQWIEFAEEAVCKKTEFELIFRVTWNSENGPFFATMCATQESGPLHTALFPTKEAAMRHCELKFQHMILHELSDFAKTIIKKAADEYMADAAIALELN